MSHVSERTAESLPSTGGGHDTMKNKITRTEEGVALFGIRHLSPAGARHVRRFLDATDPDIVLVESPSDADTLISSVLDKRAKPPLAMLCYTVEAPVRSTLYPLAAYSPEYQALLWAKERGKQAGFMDLPSGTRVALNREEERDRLALEQAREETENTTAQPNERLASYLSYRSYNNALYEEAARRAGEPDYDAYWERVFEHEPDTGAYLEAVAAESQELRDLSEGWEKEADPFAAAVNALRETYMKRRIAAAIAEGFAPEKIVAVMGAYHVSGVARCAPMTDAELKKLPKEETRLALMPYTYYRLSTFSGYGAGNYAPYYFELMYDAFWSENAQRLPFRYMSELSQLYREKNGYSSTASVIEAVRLAQSLMNLHGGVLPTLNDLHDAAVAVMANGALQSIAGSFAALDVGLKTGEIPEGLKATPLQDDFNRQLKLLKLDGSGSSTNYKIPQTKTLSLDVRENRRVKSADAAFLDLRRSVFLNRLSLLEIPFAREYGSRQDTATWAEEWQTRWDEEVEIALVEALSLGDTIETAAAFCIKERLESASSVSEVAVLVRETCRCGLFTQLEDALKRLQELGSETGDFIEAASAACEMGFLVQYGTIRQFDSAPFVPLMSRLFLKAALLLHASCSCDDETAKAVANGMARMHSLTREHEDVLNIEIWLGKLESVAEAGDRHPFLCGFACSILLERGAFADAKLGEQVSRCLSVGNTPAFAAAWFEGLVLRNRYLLLSRPILWEQLSAYVESLDDEEFPRALVCLRRAFSVFEPREKNGVCEILARLWDTDEADMAETVLGKISGAELDAAMGVDTVDSSGAGDSPLDTGLDELNDFDFDDIL